MRTLLTSYPFIIFLAALVALLYPSCEPADPIIEELPTTATILLDFSDPNMGVFAQTDIFIHFE
jgi:hypothetical protein